MLLIEFFHDRIQLLNILMQLKIICNHPYLFSMLKKTCIIFEYVLISISHSLIIININYFLIFLDNYHLNDILLFGKKNYEIISKKQKFQHHLN